jgi:WD40 repeat protein
LAAERGETTNGGLVLWYLLSQYKGGKVTGSDHRNCEMFNLVGKESSYEHFAFVATVTGLLLVTSSSHIVVITNDNVADVVQPVERRIDILKTVRNFVFIVSGDMIRLFKVDSSVPFLTQIGLLDLHVRSISEFSPSPDGDLAVVLYNESFAGLLDLAIGQKTIKQQQDSQTGDPVELPPEREKQISDFLADQSSADLEAQTNLVDASDMQQFTGLFSPLPIRYHTGPIVAIATCPRKPLLATCGGQDRTLLVWNLAKRCVIASTPLTEPVNSCSFHPRGDLLAVGTSEKLLLYSLTFDQLVLRQKWESLSCTCVSFSNGGHLLAAGSLLIKVMSTYSAKTVMSLRGHNLSVKSITWAPNDAFFVSSGLDGNVFKWSARNWDRGCEVLLSCQCLSAILSSSAVVDESSHQPTTNYNILVATSNSSIYDLNLKCEWYHNRKGLNLTAMALPVHFSLVTGGQRGNLQVIPYPLLPAGEENPFHIGTEVTVHTAPVHCIMSSSDDQTLFTAAEDSSIFIFNIVQRPRLLLCSRGRSKAS